MTGETMRKDSRHESAIIRSSDCSRRSYNRLYVSLDASKCMWELSCVVLRFGRSMRAARASRFMIAISLFALHRQYFAASASCELVKL